MSRKSKTLKFRNYKINDIEYQAGECVLVNAHKEEVAKIGKPHYVAKIIHFTEKKNEVDVYIQWYYWPEELPFGRKSFMGANEVIESSLFCDVSIETILDKCHVYTLTEFRKIEYDDDDAVYYCRFRFDDGIIKAVGGGDASKIPVFCICEAPYNPDELMVQCDMCKDWFHFNCIGKRYRKRCDDESYICVKCGSKKRENMNTNHWKHNSFDRAMKELTKKELQEVKEAFARPSSEILVCHTRSNISITAEKFRCLDLNECLNDEVINVYFGLLTEREIKDPYNFLKCLFLDTFFFQKLATGYEAVKKWTNRFDFVDYDKIFVPIHMPGHWCLVVIDQVDKKFMYINSLEGGTGGTNVMKQLAEYYEIHVKEKSVKDIDMSGWKFEEVEDHPKQSNAYDCGMYMIKYADFYSRGLNLIFKETDMPYFRMRTAKEILNLTAN